jgi:16S rRNA (guanine527-N7)-methyltransferase
LRRRWSYPLPVPYGFQFRVTDGVSARDRAVLQLTAGQREQLDAYVALLMEANSRFNLTAINDPELIESNLVGGSLELAALLPQRATSLIDVGSGGGVPGMVVAIARPDMQVCLLDSTRKKVKFLGETAAVLGLSNVTAIHARAEELAHDPSHRETYTIGTARAVARLATLVELVLPFVTVGGMVVFPKGAGATGELDEARQAIGFVGGKHPRLVTSARDDTRYVLIDKVQSTPERFPRRTGIPGKQPIGVPAG